MTLDDDGDIASARDNRQSDLDLIVRLGLFDRSWYRARYKIADTVEPLEEWFDWAWKMGRAPNLYFEPHWYLAHNADVAAIGRNPLVHYILNGEAEGRAPSELFDPVWYRQKFGLSAEESCLAHYLRLSGSGTVSPIPDFDTDFYLSTYPDVAAAGRDPFGHFCEQGFKEDRDPSGAFDTAFYRRRHLPYQPDVNPLVDFQRQRAKGVKVLCRPFHETSIPTEVRRFTRPGEHFEEVRPLPPDAHRRARIFAFYLPQFHAIRENDNWWGKGFTEWTNLMRGLPRFSDHYQPRIPRDLGFYELHDSRTLSRQIKMAHDAGISGFVFYFYWFNGKRLLDAPIERFLTDDSLDMPFCLMWANENWTRKWDGRESEVLIWQDYRRADDEALVRCFGRHFSDRRYIRLQGRPLLMIYRPDIIPSAVATIARWRSLFREICSEDPILLMVQGFGTNDPRDFGLDGAIEFPPHKICAGLPSIAADLNWLDPDSDDRVVSFEDSVAASLSELEAPFPLIKTAFPGWDNDARREGKGMVVHGATPAAFQSWLSTLIDRAQETPVFGEPIVCINAWNEWAEGAYLEPDMHFGAAFLNAVGRAASGAIPVDHRTKILLVGHSAHDSDTRLLLLSLGRRLRVVHGLVIEFLLLEGGSMLSDYAAEARTLVASDKGDLHRQIAILAARGFKCAIVNTIAAGGICGTLAEHGLVTTLLANDLGDMIRSKNISAVMRLIASSVTRIIFPTVYLQEYFRDLVSASGKGLPDLAVVPLRPFQPVAFNVEARTNLRQDLGVPADAQVVLGLGHGDLRNGFDLFLQVWRSSQDKAVPVHCIWSGDVDRHLRDSLSNEIEAAQHQNTFHILGPRRDLATLLSAADVFVLTTRDDPLPSILLQAAAIGLPSVAFQGSGGAPDFLMTHQAGETVPMADAPAMAQSAIRLAGATAAEGLRDRQRFTRLPESSFRFDDYGRDILDQVDPAVLRSSVVVINANSARTLPLRLRSIFNQTSPVREVILIDYESNDDSVSVARATADEHSRSIRHLQGHGFCDDIVHHWQDAAMAATGTYLWMTQAEGDSDPHFLEQATLAMDADPEIAMVFSNSLMIDGEGRSIGVSCRDHYDLAVPGLLAADGVFDGQDFLVQCLTTENLISDTSAVLWRRSALIEALERRDANGLAPQRGAALQIYADVAAQPKARIAYLASPLSRHRKG